MLNRFMRISLIVMTLAAPLGAQDQLIRGPILGFMPDAQGSVIWPIVGIPGASRLGDRIEVETEIRGAVISPKQDYAIAVRSDDAQVVMIDLVSAAPELRPLNGAIPGAEVIAVSPAGRAAALYNRDSKIVQVIARLPEAPEVFREFDVTAVPGRATEIAVSDDGEVALVRFVDGDNAGLWMMDASGVPWRMLLERPTTAAFLPNRRDAVVTAEGGQSAYLIVDVGRASAQIPVISASDGLQGLSSISASEDGKRVFFTGAAEVAILDLETLRSSVVSCLCQPSGLYRLKGTSVFRLTGPSTDPVIVLDATSDPRFVLIPPKKEWATQKQ